MTVSAQEMKDNRLLRVNVDNFKDAFENTRALVIKEPLDGLVDIAVGDYWNLIVLERDDVLAQVPTPDFLVYQDSSPYRNNQLYLPELFAYPNTIHVLNWKSVETFKKLNRSLEFYSVNYLVKDGISDDPSSKWGVDAGLDGSAPGVHLARIMGCSDIYYTGSADGATTVDISDIEAFVAVSGRYVPANLIRPNRPTVLNEVYL